MSTIWIALAAQLSISVPPHGPDVRPLFSPEDMPDYVQLAGIDRLVPIKTTVRPDGSVQGCAVERSSGDPYLDTYTCSIVLRRAKLEPGTWLDGSPAYSVLRVPVTWSIGGPPSKGEVEKAYPADLEVPVDSLPKGASRQARVALMIAVDESGRVLGCSEFPKDARWDPAKTLPELVPIACQRMMSHFIATPARDASGKAVRSVQSASVEFKTDK